MSDSDIKDLQEFNTKVASDSPTAMARTDRRAIRGYDTDSKETSSGSGEKIDGQMWAVHGNRNYVACERAVDTMPPGQYTISISDQIGLYFKSTDVTLDELMDLPDSAAEQVIDEIETFWKKEEHFRKFGFLWKRGVLMWGPPGSGKTSTLQMISKRIIDRGGISIYVDRPDIAAKGLALLRQVEPNRPLIVMLEDVDAIIDSYGESDLLALMDGELQIDNVVFVATTNYPERLDKRFVNRPSRFDIVKKIGMPTEGARELYLTTKNDRLKDVSARDELDAWIAGTKGFSVAHLKELIVSVEVFGVPLDSALARLKTMMERSPKSSDASEQKAMGFTNND